MLQEGHYTQAPTSTPILGDGAVQRAASRVHAVTNSCNVCFSVRIGTKMPPLSDKTTPHSCFKAVFVTILCHQLSLVKLLA